MWKGLMGGACGRSSFERFMWEGLVGGALWEKLFERFMWEGLVGEAHFRGSCGRDSYGWG